MEHLTITINYKGDDLTRNYRIDKDALDSEKFGLEVEDMISTINDNQEPIL